MILVTGATGLVGRALLPRLAELGADIRCLLRPSRRSPHLPRGVPVQVSIASLGDARAVRSAMAGVETVIHLATAEWRGLRGDLMAVDVTGTRALIDAAREAGVRRLVFCSHLGADRASAYPVLKAKGIAEEFIRQSGIAFTIVRSALVYGREDISLNSLAALLRFSPGVALMPGDGQTTLQPLWVDDLATCLAWSLGDAGLTNQTVSIGGPEFFSVADIIHLTLERLRLRRMVVAVSPLFWRWLAWFFEQALPRSPVSARLLDHLAVNRVCELTSVTRYFGLKPARLPHTIGYLSEKRWLPEMRRIIWR